MSANAFTLMLGVSYNPVQGDAIFHWENMTFYDSECRFFENGDLSPNLKPNTCIEPNSKACSYYVVSLNIYYLAWLI